MDCPKCGTEDLHRESVDIGVGVMHGPYGCHVCGWSEDDQLDFSDGRSHIDEDGNAMDQYGNIYPAGSKTALAHKIAEGIEPLSRIRDILPRKS